MTKQLSILDIAEKNVEGEGEMEINETAIKMRNKYQHLSSGLTEITVYRKEETHSIYIDTKDFQKVATIDCTWRLYPKNYGNIEKNWLVMGFVTKPKRKCYMMHRVLIDPTQKEDVIFVNRNFSDLRQQNLLKVPKGKGHSLESERLVKLQTLIPLDQLLPHVTKKKREERDAATPHSSKKKVAITRDLITKDVVVTLNQQQLNFSNMSEADAENLVKVISHLHTV